MKALIVVAVAAGFMGTMGLAQAGVPVSAGASVAEKAVGHVAPVASPDVGQSPSRADQNASGNGQGSSKPSVPGARNAQSNALNYGQEMAILGGGILALGVGLLLSNNGGNHSNTPGTGGTSGTSGTTGTN